MGKRIGTAILMAAILYGLSAEVPARESGVTCDQFDVKWSLSAGEILLQLDTDLPDDTTIMASICREFREGKEPKETFEFAYTGVPPRSSVKYWRQPRRIPLDSEDWVRRFHKHQMEMRNAGLSGETLWINDSVSLSFVVPVNQENPAFGRRNGNLRGKEVRDRGGIRVVEWEKDVLFPLKLRLGGLTVKPDREIARRCEVFESSDFGFRGVVRQRYRLVLNKDVRKEEFRSFIENFIRVRVELNWEIDVIAIFVYSSKDAYEAGGGLADLGQATWGPDAPSVSVSATEAQRNDKTAFKLVLDDRGSGWDLREARRAEASGGERPSEVPSEEELRVHRIAMKEAWARPDDEEDDIWKDVARKLGISAAEVKRIVFKVEMWNMRRKQGR